MLFFFNCVKRDFFLKIETSRVYGKQIIMLFSCSSIQGFCISSVFIFFKVNLHFTNYYNRNYFALLNRKNRFYCQMNRN
jgi:hypothetical protein